MNQVIVLGNDHTNSVGVIQSLGSVGFHMIAFMWGAKTGMVKCSKYTKEIFTTNSIESCIDLMIDKFGNTTCKIPIIACCDSAALAIEKNATRLNNSFLFAHTTSTISIEMLLNKDFQVNIAKQVGFNVPKSWIINNINDRPSDIIFPCLIKPLISCEGAKSDIRVCRTREELDQNIESLHFIKRILIQQYIDRDYEISILGCGKKDGSCIIPAIENKLSLYPKNVGLECLTYMEELRDVQIIRSVKSLIKAVGYIGTFSVEMMHCKTDGKFYFTEINPRNDGANALVLKYGVNLPLHFIYDIFDKTMVIEKDFHPGYYIWDMHHFLSMIHRDISMSQWLREIRKSKGFMLYFSNDVRPFYRQYINWILTKLHLRGDETYQ